MGRRREALLKQRAVLQRQVTDRENVLVLEHVDIAGLTRVSESAKKLVDTEKTSQPLQENPRLVMNRSVSADQRERSAMQRSVSHDRSDRSIILRSVSQERSPVILRSVSQEQTERFVSPQQ